MARNPYFAFKQFRIDQSQCAMKVTTDACLFGALVSQAESTRQSSSILDIGAGTGLLSLMIAQNAIVQSSIAQNSKARITAVELDKQAAKQATSNASASPWSGQITVVQQAIQDYQESVGESTPAPFDCIVSNPPFFQKSHKGNDHRRNMARHTDSLTFTELAGAVSQLLSREGRAWILLPVEFSDDFIREAINQGLFLHQTTAIRPSEKHTPHRHILLFGKTAGEEKESKLLTIYENHPNYTEEARSLMTPFYLHL